MKDLTAALNTISSDDDRVDHILACFRQELPTITRLRRNLHATDKEIIRYLRDIRNILISETDLRWLTLECAAEIISAPIPLDIFDYHRFTQPDTDINDPHTHLRYDSV